MRRYTYSRCPGTIPAILYRLVREESGQDLVEYTLLLTLIALGLIAAIDHLGDSVYRAFRHIVEEIIES